MEGSGAVQNGQPSAAPPQQASLIRPEQVKKLPHLNDETKARQEGGIQKLWDVINSRPPNSQDYQDAYARLSSISASLMHGMRQYQSRMKQQAAAQAGQQNGTTTNSHAPSNPTTFEQLDPAIKARVNATQFIFPPAMTEGQPNADNWLREAKARFGQALQRSEMAKQRKLDLQRNLQARQQAGVVTPEEMTVFSTKIQQCQKAIAESDNFMSKFREQQQNFRQQAQQRFAAQGQPGLGDSNDQPMLANVPGNQPAQGPQGPTPHSISSAVSAARNQASAAPAAASPQTEQAQVAQGQNTLGGTPASQHHPSHANPSPYNMTQSQADVPASATSQHLGPPRSLSHQAAMSQSAQSHAALQQSQQAQSAAHAHPPPGYLNNPKKDDRQPITKNLRVASPAPIPVPPARPTLNGGPGVGMPGQMGQPAILSMPGYVLETSEDGRVLSKKKLHELVREVCGPGGDEQLTPEVEEVSILQPLFCDSVYARRLPTNQNSVARDASFWSSVVRLAFRMDSLLISSTDISTGGGRLCRRSSQCCVSSS
jgi:transcription initiation factor TFIID subunit 12